MPGLRPGLAPPLHRVSTITLFQVHAKRNPVPDTDPVQYTPLPGVSYNYAIQGDFSFDGRGGFTFDGEYLGVMAEPYPNPAVIPPLPTSTSFTAPIHHYSSEGAGSYRVELEAKGLIIEIKFDHLNIIGTPYVVKGAIFRGRLTSSSVGSVVFLNTTSPIAEDLIGYPSTKMQRICNAYGSMIKLSPGRCGIAIEQRDRRK